VIGSEDSFEEEDTTGSNLAKREVASEPMGLGMGPQKERDMSVRVWRLVPKERDRRGYELAGVFSDQEQARKFLNERKNDGHTYAVGTPKKNTWWREFLKVLSTGGLSLITKERDGDS
jgi:hypothetical protein